MLRILVLSLTLLSFATAARAEDHQFLHNANPSSALFECNQNTMGQMACQAGHRCKCLYSAFGSAMQGLPAGYRWDCGLEHGTCMSDAPAYTSGSYGNGAAGQSSNQFPAPQVVSPFTPNPTGSTDSTSSTSTTSSTDKKTGATTTTTTTTNKSTTTK